MPQARISWRALAPIHPGRPAASGLEHSKRGRSFRKHLHFAPRTVLYSTVTRRSQRSASSARGSNLEHCNFSQTGRRLDRKRSQKEPLELDPSLSLSLGLLSLAGRGGCGLRLQLTPVLWTCHEMTLLVLPEARAIGEAGLPPNKDQAC
jgi:hypothetical protein